MYSTDTSTSRVVSYLLQLLGLSVVSYIAQKGVGATVINHSKETTVATGRERGSYLPLSHPPPAFGFLNDCLNIKTGSALPRSFLNIITTSIRT